MIISCNCVVCYIGGCPRLLRSDRETENARISFLQPFLRRHGQDSLAGENSYQYGKSVYNQVCINLSHTSIVIVCILKFPFPSRELKFGGLV